MEEVKNKYNKKLLDRYLMLCKNKGLTEESVKAFKIDLVVFMRHLGDKNVDEITHIEIEDFLDYCMNVRGNTPPTLDRKYVSINCFYKTMLLKEYFECKNPMDKIDKIKVRKKIREHLTPEEYEQLINYLEGINDLRGIACLKLVWSSGIRLSEIVQLNRNSLDFENRRFRVLGKGMKPRECIFSEEAGIAVQEYLKLRVDDLEALFISRQHNRWAKKTLQEWIKNAGIRCGIVKNLHPHIVRHGCAMDLLKRNVPLENIQIVLGHNNISTTQIYAHSNMDDVQKIVEQARNNNINKKEV